jgi:hypothetical protein
MVGLCVLFLLLLLAALTWRAAMAGKFWVNPNKLTVLHVYLLQLIVVEKSQEPTYPGRSRRRWALKRPI